VYVDNLIITGTPKKEVDKFKAQMEEKFKMSDIGLLPYYLGIEVTQTGGDISIKQSAYANKILKEAETIDCNETLIPIDPGTRLTNNTEGTLETRYKVLATVVTELTLKKENELLEYGESPISWSTQKQATVALSSCESEFIAATAATTQAL
nr:ribonuclease H-like domain, reverse transcriptase, RNA-dependent DNA polymerase [Tanacetum cinerariifolium]